MKKTRIILAMSVNSQSSKGAQMDLIGIGCSNQAIHLRNEIRQGVHRNILIALSLGLDTWRYKRHYSTTEEEGVRVKILYSTGISAWTLSRSMPSRLRAALKLK